MTIFNKKIKKNAVMTYVELIVVLSIFAVLSSVIIFNHGKFQAKVDLKNLASDIALKIVEAQKSALSGKWNSNALTNWKPSYGVFLTSSLLQDYSDNIYLNKKFIYFADLDQNNSFDDSPSCTTTECLEKITITKGNYIDRIDRYSGITSTQILNPLSVTFKRPDSSAVFKDSNGVTLTGFDYMQITIKSPKEVVAFIKIYPSGRVQVN